MGNVADHLTAIVAGSASINDELIAFFSRFDPTTHTPITQTYATTTRTIGPYTSDSEATAYTGGLVLLVDAARVTDLNELRVAYENLRVFVENIAGVVNSIIDDLQTAGLEA